MLEPTESCAVGQPLDGVVVAIDATRAWRLPASDDRFERDELGSVFQVHGLNETSPSRAMPYAVGSAPAACHRNGFRRRGDYIPPDTRSTVAVT